MTGQQSWCYGKHSVNVYCSKPRISEELEQQIKDSFATVHLECLSKSVSPCVSDFRSECRVLGPVLKPDTEWLCMNFKVVQEL
jgi:hypothetical protein